MIDAIASLGSPGLCATSVVLFAVWLCSTGALRVSFGFALGIAAVSAITLLLKLLVATPSDTLWSDDALVSQYFPSGHAALATAIYGSVATAAAFSGGGRWRYLPVAALALAIAVATARVLMRLHPVGDALAGVAIGLIAPVATFAALARHGFPLPSPGRILGAFMLALCIGWAVPAPVPSILP